MLRPWNPIDTRSSDDTGELKYYFEVTAARCKPVKSGDIQVKNPKVISMEWEENTVYYNDKIKLLIKSLEMADESPDAKLLLYEKGMVPEDEPLLEFEVTINKDDLEQEVKIDFEMDKINNPDASIGVCCSHKVIALGFNTLCYDAERRGIKPSARIKPVLQIYSCP